MKYKKQLEEALDTIEDLKEKLRESLTKRKKLSESHEIIEQMEEHTGTHGPKETITYLIIDNEKLSKYISQLKKELEQTSEKLNQAQKEKGNIAKAIEKAMNALRGVLETKRTDEEDTS